MVHSLEPMEETGQSFLLVFYYRTDRINIELITKLITKHICFGFDKKMLQTVRNWALEDSTFVVEYVLKTSILV